MGMLGLLSCLLSNRTSRSVTMETASTQPSVMGTRFPALSEDFPFCHEGGAPGHSLSSQEPPGTWLFQWQITVSPLLGKVPGHTGTFCSPGWQRLSAEGFTRSLGARPSIPQCSGEWAALPSKA